MLYTVESLVMREVDKKNGMGTSIGERNMTHLLYVAETSMKRILNKDIAGRKHIKRLTSVKASGSQC